MATPVDISSFTPEQTKAFQNAAALAPTTNGQNVLAYSSNPNGTSTNYLTGGGIDTGTYAQNSNGTLNFTPTIPSTITSSSLQSPTSPITPVQPNDTPIPIVNPNSAFNSNTGNAPAGTPLTADQATPNQPATTKLQDTINSIMGLNTSLEGKSAYQTSQEANAGLPSLQAANRDLQAQLTGLTNEANAIPLQIQNQFQQTGATQAGVAPFQKSALRDNAIKALNISTLLAANQGQIANAQATADRAVAAKYDPIQEQIDALTKNLNLIIQSPDYTKEQKAAAQAQKDIQDKKQAALDKAKANETAVQKAAIAATQNAANFTPTTEYPTLAVALQAMQNSGDPVKAAAIAQATRLEAAAKQDTSVVEVGGRKVLINTQTGQTIQDLGSSAAPGDSLLTVSEAQALGVPYGTTKSQAASKGIVPGAATGQSQYQIQSNQRIVDSVDALLPQISDSTAGIGGKTLGLIPGTPAYNFRAQLDTLKSNIAFGALTQMREASKTGGALGQISDAEERLLSSTLGALDPGQSPDVLKAQLQKIKDSITRWNQAVSNSGTTSSNTTDQYASFRSQLQPGEILVNRGGQAVAIQPNELQSSDIKL